MDAGLKYMILRGFTTIDFNEAVPNTPKEGFKVMINPETFERTLGVKSEKDKTARSGNSSGHDAGLDAEKYAFDLIFDGTGVIGKRMTGMQLDETFQTFIRVVYAHRESEENKKVANFVEIEYCGETFQCKMESMTIHYQLFGTDGYPIRIKVNCRFTSVEKSKTEDPNKKKKKKDEKKKKPVTKKTPNHDCVNPDQSYKETKESAEQNDSVSLMTCGYPRSQMSSSVNYTPVSGELNYTPADGYCK